MKNKIFTDESLREANNIYRKSLSQFSLFLIGGFLAAFLGITACNKEADPISPDVVTSTERSVNSREGGFTREEKAAIEQHLQRIEGFRNLVGSWRTNGTTATMPAQEAVEKTEIAFNYNLGDVTSIFQSYETVETKIMVSATSSTWSGSNVVGFFDAVKGQVKAQLDAGPNRTLRLLSLGTPTLVGSEYQVEILIMTGINKLTSLPTAPPDDTRWTLAPLGFTPITTCAGSANSIIGAFANGEIGVYQPINAGPGSGGNTPLPGKVVSNIMRGEHNLFGATFPSGTNYPLAYPSVATYQTGKQAWHYNDVAIAPNIPTFNCLSPTQLFNYYKGNIKLGQSMLSVVPKVQLGFFQIPRVLVATAVGAFVGQANLPSSPIIANYQEHPTRHFYGLVYSVLPPVCCLDDM